MLKNYTEFTKEHPGNDRQYADTCIQEIVDMLAEAGITSDLAREIIVDTREEIDRRMGMSSIPVSNNRR